MLPHAGVARMRQPVDRRQVLASPKNERPKTYAYDGVFGPATEQTRIYEEIGTFVACDTHRGVPFCMLAVDAAVRCCVRATCAAARVLRRFCPRADLGGVGAVPVQMWAGWAQSRCRCAPSPSVAAIAGRPILDDVLQGYNGTILTYGQTGRHARHSEGHVAQCMANTWHVRVPWR